MAVTPATFRQHYPEFASLALYPDAQVQFQIDFATPMIRVPRWGLRADAGVELMVAHYLAIERRNQMVAAAGGVPGAGGMGFATSRSVGPVSISYNANIGLSADAGFWNLTNYGLRFWQLIQMFGAGPLQI